jgi:large subunit ribosomal protein L23
MNTRHSQIIIRPLITEKTSAASMHNHYTFEVAKDANKIEIAQAVESLIKELYPKNKAQVVSVNTSAIRGRNRRSKRHARFPKDSKKAIVKIEGDAFDFYSA